MKGVFLSGAKVEKDFGFLRNRKQAF